MYCFPCLSSLQFPEDLYESHIYNRAKSKGRRNESEQMAAEGNTLTPACSSLKCMLFIKVFLKMLTLKLHCQRIKHQFPINISRVYLYSFLLQTAFSERCHHINDKYLPENRWTGTSLSEVINLHINWAKFSHSTNLH